MCQFHKILGGLLFLCMGLAAFEANAGLLPLENEVAPSMVIQVGANCYAVGQKLASQKGGTLMQASAEKQGDKTVCHIVVRVPGSDGKRPRRAEFTVPAN